MTKFSLLSSIIVLCCANAHAQDSMGHADSSVPGPYAGVGLAIVDLPSLVDGGAAFGRIGYGYEYFAVEAELGTGVGDNPLKYYTAGFAVAKLPIAKNVEAFARAGYAYGSARGYNESGPAVGVGLSLADGSVRIDATYADLSGERAGLIGVTFGRRF